jgi:PAS domain S-box-containing protein
MPIEVKSARLSPHASEDRLQQAIRASRLGIFDHDQLSNTIYWSLEQRAIYGWGPDEPVTLAKFLEQVHPADRERIAEAVRRAHDPTGPGLFDVEHRIIRRDGKIRWLTTRSQTFFEGEGAERRPVRTVGAVQDVTDQREAEEALRLFRRAADLATDAIYWLDSDGALVYVNEAACRSLGYTREELLRLTVWDVDPVHSREEWERSWRNLEEQRDPNATPLRTMHRRRDGTLFPVEVQAQHLELSDGAIKVAYVREITERDRLEAQLRQAQKMESVGRLAGGVAHDFNNLLTAISGNVELALLDLRPADPLYELLIEVHRAADSAANLTRQLLAFSRKQVIDPRVVNLNGIVDELQKMLKRLMREDVDVHVRLDPGLWQTKVDRGQLEQVLVNLAVNARDAMPHGGTLTLETGNATLDEAYTRTRSYVIPGEYVMLAVTDTGTGMDEQAKAHLFEPFFTTKEHGKGTGLGLAMVYGAVKQNRGSIEVESEPGRGTTFRIYLPRVVAAPDPLPVPSPTMRLPGGTETILLVEDEEKVRAVAVGLLRRLGYTVIASSCATEALSAVRELTGPLHLLVTDVVLPGMNGRILAQQVEALRPGTKVLYTSGYSEDVVIHHGVLDPGIEFVPKPYSIDLLARRVREVLDARR